MASGNGWNLWVWLAGGGCGWNLWVWLVCVVVRSIIIDFLTLLIPTLLVCSFLHQHPYFLFIKKKFFVLVPVFFSNYILCIKFFFRAVFEDSAREFEGMLIGKTHYVIT